MDGANIKIIELVFDKENFMFSLAVNIWGIIITASIFILLWFLIRFLKRKKEIDKDIIPIRLKYKVGGAEIEYEIVRNYQNIEIAHKIYIELITRKAAIEIEEDKDVIVEIYNSWYSLFQITREQLKAIKGKLLRDNNTSKDLVRLLTDILNKGLRPHLTEYQARFRKWYQEQIENKENVNKSPQEIQKEFKDYDNLIKSMKEVNQVLIEYSIQLKKIIEGK
jgi:hypothetical protein